MIPCLLVSDINGHWIDGDGEHGVHAKSVDPASSHSKYLEQVRRDGLSIVTDEEQDGVDAHQDVDDEKDVGPEDILVLVQNATSHYRLVSNRMYNFAKECTKSSKSSNIL